MTPEQKFLARHALGLTRFPTSYRNRFHAVVGTSDYREWREMVDAGDALRYPWATSYGDLFTLTHRGAEAALEQGERLDPEDFP